MPTSLRLDRETEERLDLLAANTGRTKAYYLRQIIKAGIDDVEDYYLGMETLEKIRKGEMSTRPLSEVARELGLDD